MNSPSRRPTGRVPTTKPATGPVPVQKTATSRVPAAKPTTGKVPVQGGRPTTSRMAPAAPPGRPTTRREAPARINPPLEKKSNTPVLIGAGVGGVILLILVVMMSGGDGHKKPAENTKKPKAAAPVDVAGLERQAEAKCSEGLALILGNKEKMSGRDLSPQESTQLRSDLQRGLALIGEGNSLFDQANMKSGNMYDTRKYNEAAKLARYKIGELVK